jgi:hypothetical protein
VGHGDSHGVGIATQEERGGAGEARLGVVVRDAVERRQHGDVLHGDAELGLRLSQLPKHRGRSSERGARARQGAVRASLLLEGLHEGQPVEALVGPRVLGDHAGHVVERQPRRLDAMGHLPCGKQPRELREREQAGERGREGERADRGRGSGDVRGERREARERAGPERICPATLAWARR